MVVIAGDARILGIGRRDASAEVDRLYRRYADEVLRYVLVVLRSRTDAEDVVQATYIRAFRALARGEQVQKPRNWLIKIAHNECRRVLAARKRRAVEVELDEVPVEPAESGRAESLRTALSQLAPSQREALVLRELEGRSYAEIATTLAVSESAVETLIFRARRAVREQLDDVLGCEAACALIQQETLSDESRRLLRAHTRACSDCATAERRARGRKGALRRIASGFGLPGFLKTLLGKALVVAVTASAVGITGAAIAEPHAKHRPDGVPLRVVRPTSSPVVAPRHAHVAANRAGGAVAHRAPGRPRRPGAASPQPSAHRPAVEPTVAPTAAVPPSATAQPAPAAPAAAAPASQPAPALPLPKLPVELAVPPLSVPVAVPELPVPVAVPPLPVPVPELPPLPVAVAVPELPPPPAPVPVPTVQLPPVPAELPVAAPQVPGPSSVP